MIDDESQSAVEPDIETTEPTWVRLTLRPLPVPIFAFLAAFTAGIASLFCYFFAAIEKSIIGGVLCGFFVSLALLIGIAQLIRTFGSGKTTVEQSRRYDDSSKKSTFAVVVLLISVYSTMLTVGIHLFDGIFAANRPGGKKYLITLVIAFLSTLYMVLHGKGYVRRNFGASGGRNIALSPAQAILVIILMLAFGMYTTWLKL